VGTVLVSHLRRLAKEQLFLSAQLEERLDQVDRMEKQLADLETRLEFAERMLSAGPATEPRALPGDTERH
jgi:predicted nuclease with TOPRIM domain